jgi:hypothetical protein
VKKRLPIAAVVILVAATLALSCKKSANKKKDNYTCSSCVIKPEAVAANDVSSKGIYKGVLVGSSGTVKFDVDNSGSTITAEITIDGAAAMLTSSVTWVSGQAYIAPFTGQLGGNNVSITFSVSAEGSNPSVTAANVPGHPNISFMLAKETSTALIEAFEGTYSTTKPETGTFNLVLSKALGLWGAAARAGGSSEITHGDGTISGNNLVQSSDNTVVGVLNGDELDGKFKDSNGSTVTLTAKRTL